MSGLRIVDVTDEALLRRLPPCADPRFDHRTCDYWEDADRGSKRARPAWLDPRADRPGSSARPALDDNPFAPAPQREEPNPFASGTFDDDAETDASDWNPFSPRPRAVRPTASGAPRKLQLLDRGRDVFGSYAKLLLENDEAVAYAQFGPLSAYP